MKKRILRAKTILLIASVAVLALLVPCFAAQRTMSGTGRHTAAHVLIGNPVELTALETDYKALREAPAFNTHIPREKVRSITFLRTLKDAPDTAADASAAQDGSVRAWAVSNEGLSDLFIAADGGVTAPEDSSALFACMPGLRYIDFGRAFRTEGVRNMAAMFYRSCSLSDLDLKCFDTSRVTDMSAMFKYCDMLTDLDLKSFDTSGVKDMSDMFYYCTYLEDLDLGHFDTSMLTDMSGMFYWCCDLEKLKIGSFDTSRVTDMSETFYYCTHLKDLDVRNFNTSNVRDMHGMFQACSRLKSLDLSGFDFSKTDNMTGMFHYCLNLKQLDLGEHDRTSLSEDVFELK